MVDDKFPIDLEERRAGLRRALAFGDLGAIALSADAFSRTGDDMGGELRMELIDAASLALCRDCGQGTLAGCTALLKAASHGMPIPSLAWARLLAFTLSNHQYMKCLEMSIKDANGLSCALMKEPAFRQVLVDAKNCLRDSTQSAALMSALISKATPCNAWEKPRLIAMARMLAQGCSAFDDKNSCQGGGLPYPDPLSCPGLGGLFSMERAQAAIRNRNFDALDEAFGELFLSSPDSFVFDSIRRLAEDAGWKRLEGKLIICHCTQGLWLASKPDPDSCEFICRNIEWEDSKGLCIRDLCSRFRLKKQRAGSVAHKDPALAHSPEKAKGRQVEPVAAIALEGRHALSEELKSRFMPMYRKWLSDPGKSRAPHILLSGDSGSGKTWSAQAILRKLGIKDTMSLDACGLGFHIHESAMRMKDVFSEAAEKSGESGRPCAVIMEGIDSVFLNRQALRSENDWTAEEVQALVSTMDAAARDAARVIVVATAQSEDEIDPAVLARFPFAQRLGSADAQDACGICQALLGARPDERVAALLSGRSPGNIARFCERVLSEQDGKADLSFDGCIGILNRLDGFTLRNGAEFDLPGQREFTRLVNDTVVRFLSNPDAARRFKVEFPSSMVLYGKTGTGKTHAANSLARFLGWKVVRIDASSLQAADIARVFKRARSCTPCVVVMDEVECIAGRRDSPFTDLAACDEFLRVLDTARSDRILVIGTTNFLDKLDPAELRKGRFGCHARIDPLCREDCLDLARSSFEGIPLEDGFDFNELARRLDGRTAAEASAACEEARAMAASQGMERVTMRLALEAVDKVEKERGADEAHLEGGSSRIGFI